MPKMHLKQLGFTDSACRKFTKNKERIQKFKELRDSRDICRIELDKDCFQLDIPYWDFKDSVRRTASDKVLRGKVFSIARIPKGTYFTGL